MKPSKQRYFFFYSAKQKEAQSKHRNVLPLKSAMILNRLTISEYTFRTNNMAKAIGFDDYEFVGFGIVAN